MLLCGPIVYGIKRWVQSTMQCGAASDGSVRLLDMPQVIWHDLISRRLASRSILELYKKGASCSLRRLLAIVIAVRVCFPCHCCLLLSKTNRQVWVFPSPPAFVISLLRVSFGRFPLLFSSYCHLLSLSWLVKGCPPKMRVIRSAMS